LTGRTLLDWFDRRRFADFSVRVTRETDRHWNNIRTLGTFDFTAKKQKLFHTRGFIARDRVLVIDVRFQFIRVWHSFAARTGEKKNQIKYSSKVKKEIYCRSAITPERSEFILFCFLPVCVFSKSSVWICYTKSRKTNCKRCTVFRMIRISTIEKYYSCYKVLDLKSCSRRSTVQFTLSYLSVTIERHRIEAPVRITGALMIDEPKFLRDDDCKMSTERFSL
jgi:hypothetical protein